MTTAKTKILFFWNFHPNIFILLSIQICRLYIHLMYDITKFYSNCYNQLNCFHQNNRWVCSFIIISTAPGSKKCLISGITGNILDYEYSFRYNIFHSSHDSTCLNRFQTDCSNHIRVVSYIVYTSYHQTGVCSYFQS